MGVDSGYSRKDNDANRWNNDLNFEKSRLREHPQEEELQRFKKEFEACYTHQLAQEKFNKGRKALYAGLGNVQTMHEKPLGSKRFAAKEKDLHHQMYKSELFTAKQNESRRRSMNKDFRLHSMIDYNEKLDVAPTRIVILRLSLD
ncbi:hypothetical protein V6N13_090819 [Hibiscus sabdariffa]